jgi:hypothetical protein
MMASILQPS